MVARQATSAAAQLTALCEVMERGPPRAVITLARGSSDHAAAYLAHLIMVRTGLVACSLPPSVVTLYGANLAVHRWLAIAVSQSGRSPDLVLTLERLRVLGATTVAMVNDEASPLAKVAALTLGIKAGEEKSVAATKTFLATLALCARWIALWTKDARLLHALGQLPQRLQQAAHMDWGQAVDRLAGCSRIMVVGRGGMASAASEMALKLKETCAIQAEAFSSAEIQHGPLALVLPGYPLIVVADRGPSLQGLLALSLRLRGMGADVLLMAPAGTPGADYAYPVTDDPTLDPLCAVQAFYVLAAGLAQSRQMDPDAPRNLNKVTQTI